MATIQIPITDEEYEELQTLFQHKRGALSGFVRQLIKNQLPNLRASARAELIPVLDNKLVNELLSTNNEH